MSSPPDLRSTGGSEWIPGRVAVSPEGGIGGFVLAADRTLGALFVPDGGLFGHPGVAGWVTFRAGSVVERYFGSNSGDPAVPPRVERPRPAALPLVNTFSPPRPSAPVKPPVADRVKIGDRTHAVIVSSTETEWRVKGTVDGRVFRSVGPTEVRALASWRDAVVRDLELE